MQRVRDQFPLLAQLKGFVEELPSVKAYLTSPRRIAFNQDGLFRRYPELDES
jgi:glutathione S-transferase